MSQDQQQMSLFKGYEVKHHALSLKASKLDPHNQPTRAFKPDEEVYFVVKGFVDFKTSYDRAEGGLVVEFANVTATQVYELDKAVATPLIEQGESAVRDVLRERMGVVVDDMAQSA